MNVLVTLKINDTKGKLLKTIRRIFYDETGATSLDELMETCGDAIQEYMLSCTNFSKTDSGKAILIRFHYIVLQDNEQDEPNNKEERIIVGDGHIVVVNELINYIAE